MTRKHQPARYIKLTPNRIYQVKGFKIKLYAIRGGGFIKRTQLKLQILLNQLTVGALYSYIVLLRFMQRR